MEKLVYMCSMPVQTQNNLHFKTDCCYWKRNDVLTYHFSRTHCPKNQEKRVNLMIFFFEWVSGRMSNILCPYNTTISEMWFISTSKSISNCEKISWIESQDIQSQSKISSLPEYVASKSNEIEFSMQL